MARHRNNHYQYWVHRVSLTAGKKRMERRQCEPMDQRTDRTWHVRDGTYLRNPQSVVINRNGYPNSIHVGRHVVATVL